MATTTTSTPRKTVMAHSTDRFTPTAITSANAAARASARAIRRAHEKHASVRRQTLASVGPSMTERKSPPLAPKTDHTVPYAPPATAAQRQPPEAIDADEVHQIMSSFDTECGSEISRTLLLDARARLSKGLSEILSDHEVRVAERRGLSVVGRYKIDSVPVSLEDGHARFLTATERLADFVASLASSSKATAARTADITATAAVTKQILAAARECLAEQACVEDVDHSQTTLKLEKATLTDEPPMPIKKSSTPPTSGSVSSANRVRSLAVDPDIAELLDDDIQCESRRCAHWSPSPTPGNPVSLQPPLHGSIIETNGEEPQSADTSESLSAEVAHTSDYSSSTESEFAAVDFSSPYDARQRSHSL